MTNSTWTHLLAATALALMALIIHGMIRNDPNVRPLDTARYYTMVRERGDVSTAKQLVSNEDSWLSLGCRPNVSKALPTTDACIEERRALRNKILQAMNCFTYNSQVCSYLRNITAGIIQNRTISGTVYATGRSLLGTVPNQGTLTYRQLLYNAIEQSPYLFHNSYRAAQGDEFYVLRTVLYNFVVFAILGNIVVHFMDQYHMSWGKRLAMRILVFALFTFLVSFLFLLSGMGSFFTAGVGIWIPGLVVLLYYEAFLDATITRPWIHPYTFSVIYTSLSILALTENDVLNDTVIALTVAQAQAVSLLYMQIVWYWAGKNEKITHVKAGVHATQLYTTKEMQCALLLALLAIFLLSYAQTTGPFDYNAGDLNLRVAPCVFLILAIWGTLYLQDMNLDDEYGKEVDRVTFENMSKSDLVTYATRITGGKLAVSLLLIIFGVLFELNMVGEYFRGLRAYIDKIPERAWQLDIANKYTIGNGFLPSPTTYL